MLLLFWNGVSVSVVVPTVTTDLVTEVSSARALAVGSLSSNGGAAITERGFVVSTSINPTISNTKFVVSGSALGAFVSALTSLDNHTTYYVRAYATNSAGTGYGNNITFITARGFLQKTYYYKIYDATTGTYVTSWTKEVLSEPSFRSIINGGPGALVVRLARAFDSFGEDSDVKLNNRVECYAVDNDTPLGTLIYSGYISGYKPIVKIDKEYVEVTVFGYMAELERMILTDGSGNTTIVYNSYDPSDILKDVIDKARVLGCHINYSATSIMRTNTTVSYTFNTNTIKECLDKIIELTPLGWYWRIDPTNTIYLANKNIYADHTFSLGLEVENLETYRRIEDLINRVLFVGGGAPPLYRIYENTSSQTAYGLYTKKIVDQRVTVVATAATIANRQIDAKKDPEIRSLFTIIDNSGPSDRGYDIETVRPGQTLKVKNLRSDVAAISLWDVAFWDTDVWDQTLATSAADVIQILSVAYTPDSINIEASSRLPEIAKRIEDVQRNLESSQTVDNPVAPS